MNGKNLTKFCTRMIYVGIVKGHFSHICNRVMDLDWRQNLVYAQYLENDWTEFNQILYDKIYVWIVTCHQFFKQSYSPEYIFVL